MHEKGIGREGARHRTSIAEAAKGGRLYISDTGNHRVQRWDPGAKASEFHVRGSLQRLFCFDLPFGKLSWK